MDECEYLVEIKRSADQPYSAAFTGSNGIDGGFFFFFQAEDGIRDYKVTGVQTCALPILQVGVGEIVARDAAPKAHVVKLALMRAQAGFDVAQTLAICELGKSQTQELIEAGETLHLVVAVVAVHATAKLGERKQVHQLSKNRAATVHAPSLGNSRNAARIYPDSNRFCSFSRLTRSATCTYRNFRNQHWDSTDSEC